MRTIFASAALLLLAAPAWADMTPQDARGLTAAMTHNGMLRGIRPNCVAYHVEGETQSVLEVQAYEIHDNRRGCPGDEDSAPTIANVIYLRMSGQVLKQNPGGSSYILLR